MNKYLHFAIHDGNANGLSKGWAQKSQHVSSKNYGKTNRYLVVIILALSVFQTAGADDRMNTRESGAEGGAYLDSSARLVPLESQVARRIRVWHALGFKDVEFDYLVAGEKSPVRLTNLPAAPEFVVRLDNGMDPLESIQFYRVDGAKGARTVPVIKVDVLERVSKPKASLTLVDFNAGKYKADSFKISPTQPLQPGEYCLMVMVGNIFPTHVPGYCFGVDRSESKNP